MPSTRFKELWRRQQLRQDALDVKAAMDVIQESQEFLREKEAAREQREAEVQASRVKPKGNKSFSDML